MNVKTVVSSIVALSLILGASSSAFAQGYSREHRNDDHRDDRHDERSYHGDDRGRGDRDDHDNRRREHFEERHDNGRHANFERRYETRGRGAGPHHNFYKGKRLPSEYRHRQYVVEDWRGHHLSSPPRGYHWVQVGGDYVLVAVATGIIMQLLLNNN
ncbi:MAG: RcnB family protein [Pseudomonadota bacterium]